MRTHILQLILLCVCLGVILPSNGQYYSRSIPVESDLILPPDYNPSLSYPVVVMLPYTSGTAENMFNAYARDAGSEAETLKGKLADILVAFNAKNPGQEQSFVVMLPKGRGSRRDHSWRGFKACYEKYEERVMKDIRKFSKTYNLDTTQIYLTGVSLGGDLSWALSQRHPEFFQGAIVMGSRCSYPPPEGALELMAEKDYAFFMTMGMLEANDRLIGMRYSRKLLDSMQVRSAYKEMPDMHHTKAPLWLFVEGLHFVLKREVHKVEQEDVSELVKMLTGEYNGDLELNHYDKDEEADELMEEGDRLYVPFKTEFIEMRSLKIERASPAKVRLLLDFDRLPALEAYVSQQEEMGQPVIGLSIPDQVIGPYQYRGTSVGAEDDKIHGILNLEGDMPYLSISFEVVNAKDKEQFTTYTFFARIE